MIPAAALKKPPARVRTPPSSPPAPPEEIKALPLVGQDPKELARIDKWGRMLRVSRRDAGGNVEQWSFDEKKGRKVIVLVAIVPIELTEMISSEKGYTKASPIAGGRPSGGPSSTTPGWRSCPLPTLPQGNRGARQQSWGSCIASGSIGRRLRISKSIWTYPGRSVGMSCSIRGMVQGESRCLRRMKTFR